MHISLQSKPSVFIPFDLLPEALKWQVGKTYRVKVVLKQISAAENGAEFEVVDASSLEGDDKGNRRYFLSEGGSYGAS